MRAGSGAISGACISGAGSVHGSRRRGLARWQAGRTPVDAGPLHRLRSTEIERTASANLSGALTMSGLFAGHALTNPGPWDSDDDGSGSPELYRTRLGSSMPATPGDLALAAHAGAALPSATPDPNAPAPLLARAASDAIVNSAYIDGTMAPGGAFSVDGRLIDVAQATSRPAATHGFDRVLGGAASGFQDVLEASAEAARAACIVYVDEGCPSVLEVGACVGG